MQLKTSFIDRNMQCTSTQAAYRYTLVRCPIECEFHSINFQLVVVFFSYLVQSLNKYFLEPIDCSVFCFECAAIEFKMYLQHFTTAHCGMCLYFEKKLKNGNLKRFKNRKIHYIHRAPVEKIRIAIYAVVFTHQRSTTKCGLVTSKNRLHQRHFWAVLLCQSVFSSFQSIFLNVLDLIWIRNPLNASFSLSRCWHLNKDIE